MGKQLRKIRSGMGDKNHLLAQRPEREYATEDVKARWRLKGRVENSEDVYNAVDANYSYHYKGKRVDMSNESPYYVDLNAHPKRCFPYAVEQHKKLPIDRLWEVRADFEATVIKRTLEYALKWEGIKEVPAPIKYRIGWSASGFEDPLSLFVNSSETNIAATGINSNSYKFVGTSLVDTGNQDYMTGTIANPSALPDTTTDLEMTVDVRPVPNADEHSKWTKWYWDSASNSIKWYWNSGQANTSNPFYRQIDGKIGTRDDDAIGFIVKGKKTSSGLSGFVFLWESDNRVITGRRLKNLNDFNIVSSHIREPGASLKDEKWAYYDTHPTSNDNYEGGVSDGFQKDNAENKTRFKKFSEEQGWKNNHMQVYKIENNILKNFGSFSSSSGSTPGWRFNQWHSVKIKVEGSMVKISAKIPGLNGGAFKEYLQFDTGMAEGTIGICNISQAVEYKNATLQTESGLSGYVPETGYDTYEGEDKQIAQKGIDYVKDAALAAAGAQGLNDITVKTIWAELADGSKGTVEVNGLQGPINLKLGKDEEAMNGRVPREGWFEWDGFEGGVYKGSKVHASDVSEFLKAEIANEFEGHLPEGFRVTNFDGEVKDPLAGHVTTAFDFVAVSSNAPDAGVTYYETHYKCGVQNVTPDNYDETTCVTAFSDVTALFIVEDNLFFNKRPDWDPDSFVRKYELTKPVAPPEPSHNDGREILETNPNSDCVIYGPEKEEQPFNECTIDFHFDGQSLCMWSCEFPIEIDVKEFEDCVFAYEGLKFFYPLEEFEPNEWTIYKVFPQLSSIKTDLDYFGVSDDQDLLEVAVGSHIEIMTSEYYEVRFPEETLNVGEVTTEKTIELPLPSFPEHYVDPIYGKPALEEGAKEIRFLLDVWENKEDVAIRWVTDKTPLTGVYEVNPTIPTWDGILEYSQWHTNIPNTPRAAVGEANMKLLIASEVRGHQVQGRHFIQIQCLERATITEWNSGMITGSVTINGGHPLTGGLRGYREVRGIPLDEVFIPEDVMEETIVGPIVSVEPLYVDWHIESDKTLTLSSQYETPYVWYTDWLSDWNYDPKTHQLTYGTVDTEAKHVFDMTTFVNKPAVDLRKLIIDRLIIESNNPFVNFSPIELSSEQKDQIKERMNRTGGVSIPAYGYFKKTYPYSWSPMVHSGYYYIEEQEKYLFANREVDPIDSYEEALSKRPRQGAPILAQNKEGAMLTKTMGFDPNTLMQSHVLRQHFEGTGHSKYYMNYKNISKESIVISNNGRVLTEEEFMFNETDNSIQFMYELTEADQIEVQFSIDSSFYVDMYEGLFNANQDVHVHFHHSNKQAELYGGRIMYEGAADTPFYYASEVKTNPLLQNMHSGFLYIDEDTERTASYLRVKASQQYVDVESGEKVTLTAEVLDENQNPLEDVVVEFFESGVKIGQSKTDMSGEAHLILIPNVSPEYITRIGVKTGNLHHALQINNTKPFQEKRKHIELKASRYQFVAGKPSGIITITGMLRDENWLPLANRPVKMTIVNTKGQTQINELLTKPNGSIEVSINATNEVRGELFIKMEHGVGVELAMNSLYIKVTGE